MPRSTQVNSIHSTRDYDAFKFLGNNRDQNQNHVNALKNAFEAFGNLTKAQPILVNENMEIIDGQHRFVACKELHEPVFYTIVPGLNITDARQMNLLHMNWTVNDFAKSYASSGMETYQKYLKLREDYPHFSHSVVLVAIYGNGGDSQGIYKSFREGELVIEDEAAVRERLETLTEVANFTQVSKAVARALTIVMEHPNFDKARLLRKLAIHETLSPYQDVRDNLRAIEDVYNYQMSEQNKVRFF